MHDAPDNFVILPVDRRRRCASSCGAVRAGRKIDEVNLRLYGERAVARHYARAKTLQRAERTILESLADDLRQAAMLDVGVGGGRTTLHFAPLVKRYVGLDYSQTMVAAARARFARERYEIVCGDARAIPFADSSFDVVLFSHNGIDYVDHDDRIRVLHEVRRVLRLGAAFAFSTHNLDRADLDFESPLGEGLICRAKRGLRRWRLRANNPDYRRYGECEHAIVNDGAFGFRAATYHIRPAAQVEQLGVAGFGNIRAFSGVTGREIAGDQLLSSADAWLYFLCERRD